MNEAVPKSETESVSEGKIRVLNAFRAFEDSGIDYCILRNFDFLTGGEFGRDVDVTARRRDKNEIDAVLKDHGFKQSKWNKRGHTTYATYLPENHEIVTIDISWDGPKFNGVSIVDFEHLFANSRLRNGCRIPGKDDYYVHLAFHCAIKKQSYRTSYRLELGRIRDEINETKVRDLSRSLFGKPGVEAIDRVLEGDLTTVSEMRWELVSSAIRTNPIQLAPFIYTVSIYNKILFRIQLLYRWSPLRKTPLIILLGPDGAGKTTLAKNFEQILESNGYHIKYHHLGVYNERTWFLASLMWIHNTITGFDEEEHNNMKSDTNRTLPDWKSPLKAIPHFIESTLKYLKIQTTSADGLVADRFVHDIPAKFRCGPLRKLVALFERHPFYGFFLSCDAEIIGSRSEYTVEGVAELIERYEMHDFDLEPLDASKSEDEVLDQLLHQTLVNGDLLEHL